MCTLMHWLTLELPSQVKDRTGTSKSIAPHCTNRIENGNKFKIIKCQIRLMMQALPIIELQIMSNPCMRVKTSHRQLKMKHQVNLRIEIKYYSIET